MNRRARRSLRHPLTDTDPCARNAAARGYTLNELLIVMALVGIVAALSLPSYGSLSRVAFNSMALSDLTSARTAVASDTAKLPTTETTIVTSGPAALSIAPHVRVSRGVRLTIEVTSSDDDGEGKGKGKGASTAPGQNKDGVDGYTITASHGSGSAIYSTDESGRITATQKTP